MNDYGLKIILSLSNATSVHAELDQFFVLFKMRCRSRTLDHFPEKLENKIISIRDDIKMKKTRIKSNSIDLMINLNKNIQTMGGNKHIYIRSIQCCKFF